MMQWPSMFWFTENITILNFSVINTPVTQQIQHSKWMNT